jgi:hypothetical protein
VSNGINENKFLNTSYKENVTHKENVTTENSNDLLIIIVKFNPKKPWRHQKKANRNSQYLNVSNISNALHEHKGRNALIKRGTQSESENGNGSRKSD